MPNPNDFDFKNIRNYEILIKEKDNKIDHLEKQISNVESAYEKKIKNADKQLVDRDKEIEKLQEQVKKKFEQIDVDEVLQKDYTIEKINNQVLQKELEQKINRIVDLESQYDVIQFEARQLRDDFKNMKQLYEQEQELRIRLEKEVNILDKRAQNSFEAEEISQIFSTALNDFNEAVNIESKTVDYVINGMDVELKAYIGKTEDNKMRMSAPEISEDAISVIKFSINSIPKDIDSDY